ncbi:unnamed protein product [Ilex paraguariensis]|uniref:Uncharacterized protein n=1 Tax=Ilex paraguariensis TaxID=185542 RepID=A0ABC8UI43_9AQUA
MSLEPRLLNPVCDSGDGHHQTLPENKPSSDPLEIPLDLPPDSFWVPKEQELDWINHNAFIERKGSIKAVLSQNFNSNSILSPQRSLSMNHKSKASIFGLPKAQKYCPVDVNLRRKCKEGKVRLVRSRSEPDRKWLEQGTEPGSPRVSCMGKVGSKRGKGKRTGFWSRVKVVIWTGFLTNRVVSKGSAELVEPEIGPDTLVELKRFESGRREVHQKVRGERRQGTEESKVKNGRWDSERKYWTVTTVDDSK